MGRNIVVTVDGPAASGKTSVGKEVARRFGLAFVSSGWFFRAFALILIRLDLSEEEVRSVTFLEAVEKAQLEYSYRHQRFFIDGKDVTPDLEERVVCSLASHVAVVPEVRERVRLLLHMLADEAGDVLFEGRDMGTEVFPDATVKIFLDASPAARAARKRARDLKQGLTPLSIEELTAELAARDKRDRERSISPLIPAHDANIVDSSDISFEQSVCAIVAIVTSRIGRRGLW